MSEEKRKIPPIPLLPSEDPYDARPVPVEIIERYERIFTLLGGMSDPYGKENISFSNFHAWFMREASLSPVPVYAIGSNNDVRFLLYTSERNTLKFWAFNREHEIFGPEILIENGYIRSISSSNSDGYGIDGDIVHMNVRGELLDGKPKNGTLDSMLTFVGTSSDIGLERPIIGINIWR